MSVSDKLDTIEERLLQVADLLDEGEYDEARNTAQGIADILNCPFCENLENGVLGGVVFVVGLNEAGRDRRADAVAEEVRTFVETDLAEAREVVANIEEEPASPEL